MNISCKFEKASYNIFFVRAVTVKSLYTLRQRLRNKAKSIVSTGKHPVDTMDFALYNDALHKPTRLIKSHILSADKPWVAKLKPACPTQFLAC